MIPEEGELKDRRPELALYRCACKHCDEAQAILGRLAREFGAVLAVQNVTHDPARSEWAGWRTPAVYLDGRELTHYQVSPKLWKEALAAGRVREPSTVVGEVIDLHCYMIAKGRGEEHRDCAAECVKAGKPIGLLTRGGGVYLLIEDRMYEDSFARLKELVSEEVGVSGDVCERGGVQSIIVRAVAETAAV